MNAPFIRQKCIPSKTHISSDCHTRANRKQFPGITLDIAVSCYKIENYLPIKSPLPFQVFRQLLITANIEQEEEKCNRTKAASKHRIQHRHRMNSPGCTYWILTSWKLITITQSPLPSSRNLGTTKPFRSISIHW